MITLYTFGPAMGLPDPSPFVMKATVLLKMSGLPFETSTTGFTKAPKGKLPYIVDDGAVIADSTFIRFHLEEKHGIDFDPGLTAEQKAIAWSVEKMCEEHLYFGMIHDRWLNKENFAKGPAIFFNFLPPPLRPVIKAVVLRKQRQTLHGQGLGRHTEDERNRLMIRDVEAIATILGGKPYLLGDKPCGTDATTFAFICGVMAPVFDIPMRRAAEKHSNLMAYRDRLMKLYFPS